MSTGEQAERRTDVIPCPHEPLMRNRIASLHIQIRKQQTCITERDARISDLKSTNASQSDYIRKLEAELRERKTPVDTDCKVQLIQRIAAAEQNARDRATACIAMETAQHIQQIATLQEDLALSRTECSRLHCLISPFASENIRALAQKDASALAYLRQKEQDASPRINFYSALRDQEMFFLTTTLPSMDFNAQDQHIQSLHAQLEGAFSEARHIFTDMETVQVVIDSMKRAAQMAAQHHELEVELFKERDANFRLQMDLHRTQSAHETELSATMTRMSVDEPRSLKALAAQLETAERTVLRQDEMLFDLTRQLESSKDTIAQLLEHHEHYEEDGQAKWQRWQQKYHGELECDAIGQPITDALGNITPKWVTYQQKLHDCRIVLEQYKSRYGPLDTKTPLTCDFDPKDV